MRKVKFGDLDGGSHFFWGGSQFVKTLQYKGGNSVELGTKSGVWGCFFDDVIVEIEDVQPKQQRLPIELVIHDGAVTGWKMPDYVEITVKDYDCPDDYGHHFEDEDGEYQKLVIVNEIEQNIPWDNEVTDV